MAQITTFLHPFRFRLLFASKLSYPPIPLFGNFYRVKILMNHIQAPVIQLAPSSSSFKFCFRKILRMPNISIAGKISKWSVVGGSFVLGFVTISPRISDSIEGFQKLLDDHPNLSSTSDFKGEKLSFLAIVKKVMVALFAVATVLSTMEHPVKLAAKLVVALLRSKPCPSSVYYIIEQCRHQYMRQHPLWYRIKPLYAKQVKVEDYKFLSVARVELHDQKFTLIGILGNWWVIQMAPCLEALSILRSKD